MNTSKLVNITELQIIKWNENKFLSSENDWQKLLENSDSDQLFLSWHWISHWWLIWGNLDTDRLSIYAVYFNQELVGLLPVYSSGCSYFKGLLPIRRLQFLGTRYNGSRGIRPEYLGAIVKKGIEDQVTQALVDEIFNNKDYDEIVLSDIEVSSTFYTLLKRKILQTNLSLRLIKSDDVFSVNVTDTFDNYLKNLGKNTRLKLYNRRKVLEKYGEVAIENIDLKTDTEIFELVNFFHHARFSSNSYHEKHINMIRKMVEAQPVNQNLHSSSILKVNGKPLSAMINIFINGKIYNINFGYLENFDKKISLGTLHLGYMLEKAFFSEKIKTFDFLAGNGKNSNYKSHLGELHTNFETIQLIRNPVLNFLYLVNDKYLRKIKGFLKPKNLS